MGSERRSGKKTKTSHEIITIQREGEIERQSVRQGTIVPRQWKKKEKKGGVGGGGGGSALWTMELVTGAQWLQCFQLDII